MNYVVNTMEIMKKQNLTGLRFGELTVIKRLENTPGGATRWLCRCDCGNQVEVSYKHLAYGNQKSCGCRKKEQEQRLNSFLTHVAGTSMDIVKSKKLPADNTTGCKGVYLIKGKYVARIVFQKKKYFLGTFDTLEAAAAARREAERVLFDGVAEHYQKWKLRAEIDDVWAEQNPIQISVSQQNGNLKVSLQPTL